MQVVTVCAGVTWMLLSLNLLRRRALRPMQSASSAAELS